MDVIKIVWDIHFDRHQNCVNKVANHCKFMIIKIAQEVVEYLRSWSKLVRTKMLKRPSRCQQPPTQPSSTEPAPCRGNWFWVDTFFQFLQRAFRFFIAKDCLLTGQEQACSRITRLVGWLFVRLSPCRKWLNTQKNSCWLRPNDQTLTRPLLVRRIQGISGLCVL